MKYPDNQPLDIAKLVTTRNPGHLLMGDRRRIKYQVGDLTNFANGGNGNTFLSGVSYDVAGQITGDTLGNGVSEQFGYDAQRLQMTSQKAGTASPYTNRMNLT